MTSTGGKKRQLLPPPPLPGRSGDSLAGVVSRVMAPAARLGRKVVSGRSATRFVTTGGKPVSTRAILSVLLESAHNFSGAALPKPAQNVCEYNVARFGVSSELLDSFERLFADRAASRPSEPLASACGEDFVWFGAILGFVAYFFWRFRKSNFFGRHLEGCVKGGVLVLGRR